MLLQWSFAMFYLGQIPKPSGTHPMFELGLSDREKRCKIYLEQINYSISQNRALMQAIIKKSKSLTVLTFCLLTLFTLKRLQVTVECEQKQLNRMHTINQLDGHNWSSNLKNVRIACNTFCLMVIYHYVLCTETCPTWDQSIFHSKHFVDLMPQCKLYNAPRPQRYQLAYGLVRKWVLSGRNFTLADIGDSLVDSATSLLVSYLTACVPESSHPSMFSLAYYYSDNYLLIFSSSE